LHPVRTLRYPSPVNRAKLFYFLYYGATAALSPFLTLYYQSLGLSGTQIGLLAGLVPLTSMVSGTLWNAAADATRRYRAILLTATGGAWLATLLVSRAGGLAALLPTVLLMAAFSAPIGTLVDSSVANQTRKTGGDYGRVRLWGSVGWGMGALLAGPVIDRYGLIWAFVIHLTLLAGVFVVSLRVPLDHSVAEPGTSFFSRLRVLLAERAYLTLLVVALVFGMSLSMALSYLFLHMQNLGASETLMSVTLITATLSEVPFMFLSGRLIRRLGVRPIIAAALVLMAARTFAYAFMPAAGWAVAINLLHGPTYATLWAASVSESNRLAPPGLGATAQSALTSAMFGLGSALGSFSGGILYDRAGAPFMFQCAGWLLLATAGFWLVASRRPTADRRRRTADR